MNSENTALRRDLAMLEFALTDERRHHARRNLNAVIFGVVCGGVPCARW